MATLNLGSFENLKTKSVIGYKSDKLVGYASDDDLKKDTGAKLVASFGVDGKDWTLNLNAEGVKAAEIKGIKETSGEKNWTMNLSGYEITEGIELGDGNDKVTVDSASDKSILLGGGNNTFTSTGLVEDVTISAEGGSDTFTLTSLKGAKVEAGAGKDTVILNDNTSATIDLGDGADTLKVSGTLESDVVVTLGEGKDSVDATGLKKGTLTLDDYNVAEDVITTGQIAFDEDNFTKDGEVSVKGGGVVKVKAESGYYAINGETEGYVAWATDGGTSIDLSSFTKEGVKIIGSNNGDAVDTLIGGTKADSIYAGAGDVVYGGAGADSIYIKASGDAAGVLVGLAAAGGKDSVNGFRTGSEDSDDTVYLFENGIGDGVKLSLTDKTKGDLVVTQGSASLTLDLATDVADNKDVTVKIQDNTGNTYAVDFVNGNVAVSSVDSIASVYYGNTARKDNALDFSNVKDSLVVDLGNTGYFQNTGSAVYAGNFASVTGGSDTTILMGKADVSETLIAGTGNTTLWGGGAKADVLVGNANTDSNVTYFYTAGDGKDTVSVFSAGTAENNADVLYLSNVSASSITRDSKAITINTADSTDKLTVVLGSGAADSVIQYTTDGQTVNQVKIGVSSKSNTFTYSDGVQAYMGGKNNTLKVTADADNANIWLDGSQGVTYENITKVDASASSNTVVIGGNGATNETLIGGTGDSSLWGGAGTSDDTLKGTYGGTTTYYFGSGDGDDVITNTGSDDKVVLYNVATSDLVAIDNSTSTMKFTLADSSTLSIKGMSTTSVKTFQLGDGSTWEYDYASKSWTQK